MLDTWLGEMWTLLSHAKLERCLASMLERGTNHMAREKKETHGPCPFFIEPREKRERIRDLLYKDREK